MGCTPGKVDPIFITNLRGREGGRVVDWKWGAPRESWSYTYYKLGRDGCRLEMWCTPGNVGPILITNLGGRFVDYIRGKLILSNKL